MSHTHYHEQLTLSPEVLQLLYLLMKHDEQALIKLVRRSIARANSNKRDGVEEMRPDELRAVVVNFFALLEHALSNATQEEETTQQLHNLHIPALAQISRSHHDQQAVARSIAKAEDVLTQGQESAREAFCKELLKQWHPAGDGKKVVKH